jgi:hypothetical protein
MKRFPLRFGVALAIVVGVGIIHTGPSGAQEIQARQVAKIQALTGAALIRSIQNCPGATANATLTLGAGSTGVNQTSPNSGYGSDTCNRYVVDINVPSTSTPPNGYQPQFSLWGQDFSDQGLGTSVSQSECNSFHVDVTYYKKANGASTFSQIYTVRYNGHWVGDSPGNNFGENSCHTQVGSQSGTAPASLTPPSAGTDTYRVAVRSYTSNALRKVKAGASRTQNPPG